MDVKLSFTNRLVCDLTFDSTAFGPKNDKLSLRKGMSSWLERIIK
jgi:hypothetical protein